MNEQAAAARPQEIDLSREEPFALGDIRVRPTALEIERRGQATSIEPRVMKALIALHRAGGATVTRDALIDQCWGGRIVSESAINRCVSQLRKALASNGGDAGVIVETIPKVGYRLQVSPARAPLAEKAPDVAAQEKRTSPLRLIAVASALGAALVAGALFFLSRPAPWTAVAYRPITSTPEIETYPALSPDGSQIVYSFQSDPDAPRDLYLQGVAAGAPAPFTSGPADDYGAAWSPRGDRVAFLRRSPGAPCALAIAPIPRGPVRIVAPCLAADYTRVSWLDESTLILSDAPGPGELRRIRAVDIETGAARDLTTPPAATLGDHDPQASPDGRYVVFRRTLMTGADDLFLLDMRAGKERALTRDGWKAAGYVWSADSRHVFFSSNRGGGFGLWTVEVRRPGPPRRVSLGLGAVTFTRMSADRHDRLAVEAPRGRVNIAAATPGGEIVPVTDGAGDDWEPAAAPDGLVAFVSTRSGSPELWTADADGRLVRVTELGASYMTDPVWSPDGGLIAFSAVRGRRAELYVVARDGSRLRVLTDDGAAKHDPVFSASGEQVFYVEHGLAGWRLMRIELAEGARPEPVPGGEGWRSLRAAPDGRLFGVREGSSQIVALNGPAPHVALGEGDLWAAGEEGIYIVRAGEGSGAALLLHPWEGAPRKAGDLPTGAGPPSAGADGRVLFSRPLDQEVDIGLLRLGRRP
ncbi:winged helix-turn-helix domain-containing protein [Amphiplicatus metriothermophilus]|uniref:WD40-like Beta Propeller Repeat n=1 Tax=Amphiplicatus metriothermophilus TaxID=1519374 RepID=A0A239PPQ9_9PROT|nr:winged helix-turn-helix domain-containing protein [Amphiplicatus metriothermophilus]MBB5518715.1 Tol biopolymer transport system component/DNA-binding winged helix-turn-helix (wHTH) protein [Amphiplicatus metriothermophilus]SNT72128.1 WD40-like Beta Propeller Repeat [Amphiplicatus metriothermophilus]